MEDGRGERSEGGLDGLEDEIGWSDSRELSRMRVGMVEVEGRLGWDGWRRMSGWNDRSEPSYDGGRSVGDRRRMRGSW